MNPPPIILAIGGSDCSAGAGIQADLKMIHRLNGYALSVVTGIVAESPLEVVSWQETSPQLFAEQLNCLEKAYPISAIKVGLVFSPALAEVLSEFLQRQQCPIVIDPVGSASAGADFGGRPLRDALADHLIPFASLITPNLMEAQSFANHETSDQAELAAILSARYQCSVLVKGGHSEDPNLATDSLHTPSGHHQTFTLPRLDAPDYHGTGCSLSSAIATELGHNRSLPIAITNAKAALHRAILDGHSWNETHALGVL